MITRVVTQQIPHQKQPKRCQATGKLGTDPADSGDRSVQIEGLRPRLIFLIDSLNSAQC